MVSACFCDTVLPHEFTASGSDDASEGTRRPSLEVALERVVEGALQNLEVIDPSRSDLRQPIRPVPAEK